MLPNLGAPSAHSTNIESSGSRFVHHYHPYRNHQHHHSQPHNRHHQSQPQMSRLHQHRREFSHPHAHRHDSPPQRQEQQPQQQPQQRQYHSPQPQQALPHRQHLRIMPSLIERLPPEVQKTVFSYLDYEALIHLSTMNRYFHRIIDPQRMADPADKAQFIMRAAKDFPQHRPSEKGHDYKPGNFECYICFRVRSPEHFDMLQPQSVYVDIHSHIVRDREPDPRSDRLIMLRRFCISCGVDTGIHAPFDCLTTRTGRDLWVCRCRKVWSKPLCLRCPDCQGDCPLRPRRKLGVDRA
ncbi:hypothetical protein M441DRAFT_60908 [Trichoderma asperellum CBS 433.97]|uniref:F-box domain-containing protein n=2 Tax=Trichoderma asperellum TaxID=101201 RepID=A0A2T3YYV7_TRIA4|nr:hypothetical protein M441DRAFT_60908 [Trichoderma asperellum CBS 433.97]PTB37749.1 hypothetical protein M441DRAFT_60908 [Trichoderma asperellum CBS 433.97]